MKKLTREEKEKKIIELEILKKELEARKYSKDLFLFNKKVLQIEDGPGKVPLADFHEELCKFVTNTDTNKKLILVPRGHLKSSLVTIGYSLMRIAQDPTIRILIANATYDMACSFLGHIKKHLQENEIFRKYYGDLSKNPAKWSENMISLENKKAFGKKEATVTAFGIGGNLVSQHYDVIIADDLVNRDYINTSEQIEKTILFYKDALDLLEPGGTFIVIGTRWSDADLYGWILDETNIEQVYKSFSVFLRQAYTGNLENGEGLKFLWPAKYTKNILETLKREKGPYEFSCFTAGTPVETKNGFVPIETLQKGDKLSWGNEVVETRSEGKTDVYEIKLCGWPDKIKATVKHPFWAREDRHFGAKWKTVGELKVGDYVGFKVGNDFSVVGNKKYWWLVGRYLSEGWVSWDENSVLICANKQEREYCERAVKYAEDLGYKGRNGIRKIYEYDDVYKISIGSKEFSKKIIEFGRGASRKHLTWQAKNLRKDLAEALIDGYLTGDGYVAKGYRQANSVSKQLLLDFKHLLAKHGHIATVAKVGNGGSKMLKGKKINYLPLYNLRIVSDGATRRMKSFVKNGYLFSRITSINKLDKKEEVFNLQTKTGDYQIAGSRVHNSQYMNEPIPQEDAKFKMEWFKRILEDELRVREINYYTMVDPAIGQRKESDKTAIVTIGVDEFNNWFVRNIVWDRLLPNKIIEHIFWNWEEFHPKKIGIELTAYQKSLQYAIVDEMRARNIYLPIVELKAERSKDERIEGLIPRYANGAIYHLEQCPYVRALEDQLMRFPRGRHVDIIDALAYGLQIAHQARKKPIGRGRRMGHSKYLY